MKDSGEGVRIVADFKKLNQAIERPVWPTESSSQLLRHISPSAKYFISLDLTSGYHQVRVDQESQNLLCITTPMGRYRYTVLGQGITSASDIFNLLTDGDIRYSGIHAIKNMDDILTYSDTLEGLKKELELFLEMCKKKNLKLKTSKFRVGEEVEFGGTIISSETVGKDTVVCILPKNACIQAFQNLKKPTTKRDVQVFCGMLASLQQWNLSVPLNCQLLQAATGARG